MSNVYNKGQLRDMDLKEVLIKVMEFIDTINKKSFKILDKMTKIRRDLHMTPELATKEYKTSSYIACELENIGLDVKREAAGTGVIANLMGDKEGRTIAIRADIDALPIQENNNVEYKSKIEGSMMPVVMTDMWQWLLVQLQYLKV